MKEINISLGISNIICGIIFIAAAIPLTLKKIPRNRWYGFRLSKSLESTDNWYQINHYGGRQMIRWSLLLICIGALYFIFPIDASGSEAKNAITATWPILICPGIAIVKTVLYAKQL